MEPLVKDSSAVVAFNPEALDEVIGHQSLTTPLKSALLACLTSHESRRWTIAEIEQRLSNLSIPCSKPAILGALSELALDISLCAWSPWNLIEHRSEWILQPKTDVLALLSGVRRLPRAATFDLSDEHQAVLLVVIGHRRRGGVSRTRIGAILGLEAGPFLDELAKRDLVYTVPGKELNWWRPTPQSLLALGLRSYTDIPELKELERWFEAQKTVSSAAEKEANLKPLLEKAQRTGSRKRKRELERRASAPQSPETGFENEDASGAAA
jgi:chromosome segregation and condensation protein ScpB